jgi:hypothetical protein
MKKVTLYTLADQRPDFIEVQYAAFKKHLKDDYRFVVLNNAINSSKRRKAIATICAKLDVECVEVKKDTAFVTMAGEKAITWWGSYTNANLACAYPLSWYWHTMCEENKNNIIIVIDSDMFLCKDISFNESIASYDAAFITQYRGLQHVRKDSLVTYPWNGICIFDTEKIPAIAEWSWACGTVNGFPVDVGGQAHFWLQKNKIIIKNISEYAIHNFKIINDTTTWLEATLNGNYHYSFSYNIENKEVTDYHCYETNWQPADNILPHFPHEFQTILQQKTIAYYEKFILNKQTYPVPTFLGLIEFENFTNSADPFIIHNKAGSGYMGFDKEYGTLKLQFIRNTLGV